MMSPRWNAGAMDSEITTITGCEELVKIESVFHAMKAVESTNKIGSVSDASVRMYKDRLLFKIPFLSMIIATFVDAHKMSGFLQYCYR